MKGLFLFKRIRCNLKHKSPHSALRLRFNSVDKQKSPDLSNLLCFDLLVAEKFKLISNKWQTKLNETQRSDLGFKGRRAQGDGICLQFFYAKACFLWHLVL